MKMDRKRGAFTLIELLIVVAIIGILAAIAIPNFLNAQVRSKVAKAQADMQSLGTGLESYYVDNNAYPPDQSFVVFREGFVPTELRFIRALSRLTTPVGHIASIPYNPFPNVTDNEGSPAYYRYYAEVLWKNLQVAFGGYPNVARKWSLCSVGPDHRSSLGEWYIFGADVLNSKAPFLGITTYGCLYDPTNGTISDGDIVRLGP